MKFFWGKCSLLVTERMCVWGVCEHMFQIPHRYVLRKLELIFTVVSQRRMTSQPAISQSIETISTLCRHPPMLSLQHFRFFSQFLLSREFLRKMFPKNTKTTWTMMGEDAEEEANNLSSLVQEYKIYMCSKRNMLEKRKDLYTYIRASFIKSTRLFYTFLCS